MRELSGTDPAHHVLKFRTISILSTVASVLKDNIVIYVIYEVAELVDLSTDTKIQGKYWYKKGCGYLQHPAYVDGCGCFPGYEVIAWMSLPEPYRREEQEHEID